MATSFFTSIITGDLFLSRNIFKKNEINSILNLILKIKIN